MQAGLGRPLVSTRCGGQEQLTVGSAKHLAANDADQQFLTGTLEPGVERTRVEGRLRKSLGEITLLGQAFVKDPDQTIEKLLKSAKTGGGPAEVVAFERYEVGAGIEKKQDDFVAEVMAQVKGATH